MADDVTFARAIKSFDDGSESTRLNDYNYELPRELIAQHPLPRRQDSRMMVLHRDRKKIEHAHFVDLEKFLRDDDLLVLNNSRVLPARHFSDDGKIEFLCLEKTAPCHWKALVKPRREFGKGMATFRPVKVEDITQHQMHPEGFSISPGSAEAIARARRIVAIGTTTVRVLESVKRRFGKIQASQGETNIFIYPPFQFRVVDVLLTNFHLPRSTLLMLVSAFAGRELILRAYEEAVRERYRFFSYGDCMLIL